jgi:hypothetical protein
MTTSNVYFTHGTRNEQLLIEDLIIESLRMYGNEFFYIPRTLVSKDEILGEDRLSTFKSSFPIEMYFENVDSYGGQGAFIQKFGLMIEQSATLVVARRRWDQFVGRYGVTTVPNRPNEGDLIYFPLTNALFEIKFVQHQDPFYQLGKLYVYKLQIELFQYSSERIDTGIAEVDAFETLKTFTTNSSRNNTTRIKRIDILNPGCDYIEAPTVTISQNLQGVSPTATATISNGKVVSINIVDFGGVYTIAPFVTISPPPSGGVQAIAKAVIEIDIDIPDSYGDNNKFKKQADTVLFTENNPFGEITDSSNTSIKIPISYDSEIVTSDNDCITMDNWR